MTRPTVTYFSDILCVWSYVSQIRLDQLANEYGDRIGIDEKFCSVFPDARTKTHNTWKDKGGYEAMNKVFQKIAGKFPHIDIHEDVWTKTQPYSSTGIHQVLKAVHLLDIENGNHVSDGGHFADTLGAKVVRRFRQAFFTEAQDISDWAVQSKLLAEFGVDPATVEAKLRSGEAAAALDADYKQADELNVKGSPTFVMNNGRQILFGNVGYKLIEANVEELFRTQNDDTASWC